MLSPKRLPCRVSEQLERVGCLLLLSERATVAVTYPAIYLAYYQHPGAVRDGLEPADQLPTGDQLPHCPVRRVVLSWCRLAAGNLGNYVAGLARNTIQHGQDGGLPPAGIFDSGHTEPIGQQASGDATYRLTGP